MASPCCRPDRQTDRGSDSRSSAPPSRARRLASLPLACLLGGCLAPRGGESPGLLSLEAERRDWASAPAVPATRADAPPRAAPLITLAAAGAPLATLLVAVARDADVELAQHDVPGGRVTVALESRPLEEVLARLAAQVPFHWRLEEGLLVVRGESPFTDTYAVDYLNLDRTTRGSVGLATRVGSINASGVPGQGGMGGGGSGGIANSSETLIESVAEHRFWESLARDVVELFGGDDAPPGSTGGAAPDGARWSINRDAGLLTLHAAPAAHERLTRYLDTLHASAQRQVLIEATVVEVALSDSFEAGIDWQLLASGLTGLSAAQVLGGQPPVTAETVGRLTAPAGLVSLVQRSGDGELGATLSLLERFGDVHILSRPRIIALNNQSSVLKVVDNRVYFTLSVERRVSEERDEIITGTEIHTVPVGLVMSVTPFIGTGDEVMLNVRPTLSRILGFVDDPNPELALANVRNGVPEIQVREMESMLRVTSGEVAIIGGLMQEATRDDERRLPGLARLPLVGRLFARASRERSRTELLVVLRPTVMPLAPRGAGR